MRKHTKHTWLIILITISQALPLYANDDVPTTPTPEANLFSTAVFNFNPPGARSLGMGSTFIGIADDATAAEANPAGLIILTKPEVSVNFRVSSTSTPTISPTSENFNRITTFDDTVSGPSFLSYVKPWSAKNAAFSVYYQQTTKFSSHEEFIAADRTFESFNEFDLLLENIGISAAVRVSPRFAIGASVRYSRLDLSITNQSFQSFLDPSNPLYLTRSFDELISDDDDSITINAGILINPNGKLSAGLVYKQGNDFKVQDDQVEIFEFPNQPLPQFVFPSTRTSVLSVPDAFGAGIAFRPNSQWTLGLDAVHISYSDTLPRVADLDANDMPLRPDDEIELHFGLEYGFTLSTGQTPAFIRAGYYINPDHDASSLIDSKQEFITFGVGIFMKEQLQLDAAIALSEDVTDGVLSMVWRL